MPYNPDVHHRRSIRLRDYDYSQEGAYFVTLCVQDKACVLGDVVDGAMVLSAVGHWVAGSWLWLADRYSFVELDEWVVMPNHLHGIIVIVRDYTEAGKGGSRAALATESSIRVKPLGSLIGAFKTISTKHINAMRGTQGTTLWQRSYYEHIIRDQQDLARIRNYINTNPVRWELDEENPFYPNS